MKTEGEFRPNYMEFWRREPINSRDSITRHDFAMPKDYYENLQIPTVMPPDGEIVNGVVIEGIIKTGFYGTCNDVDTAFGKVSYRKFDKIEFLPKNLRCCERYPSFDEKYHVTLTNVPNMNCAAKCFETPGCSSFSTDGNDCSYIIGTVDRKAENAAITEAGMLHAELCPSSTFTTTFERKSEIFGNVGTSQDAQDLADRIVEENTGNANTPLRVWRTGIRSYSPVTMWSQYVEVEIWDCNSGIFICNDPQYGNIRRGHELNEYK